MIRNFPYYDARLHRLNGLTLPIVCRLCHWAFTHLSPSPGPSHPSKISFEDANYRHFSARLARTGFHPRAECPDIPPCVVHATTMPGLQSPPYAR